MKNINKTNKQYNNEPQLKLSLWRLMLAILIFISFVAAGTSRVWEWQAKQPIKGYNPWFASYVDVTSTPTFAFDQMGATSNRDAVLSFVVSLKSDACTPSWGSVYTFDKAGDSLDLDRRIARLQQQGGSVAVSFGGLLNDELAVNCTDPDKLLKAYKSVIERYSVDTIDLDLEGSGLTDTVAGSRRASVISKLQTEQREKNKNLAVWVTLPVTPYGLSEDGTNGVTKLLDGGVDLAGVNAMTMNYGQSKATEQNMLKASESALTELHRQLGILYNRSGIILNSATIWSKIGATPMIGQNDIADEIFTLEDARGLNKFAHSRKIARMSMWSANRDISCGINYVNLKIVSDSCSGIKQEKTKFAEILSEGFDGGLSNSANIITKSDSSLASTIQTPDDPAKSPYQIWSESGTYLQGTKVVWHHNVYQAKWWTQGDIPDNAVLQSWETPWKLIGPVLPGEKPIPQITLPAGTYPKWVGTEIYNTSDRVLFNGVPYQAKWWNQGESPAAAISNPNGSPWVPLTQKQINELGQ